MVEAMSERERFENGNLPRDREVRDQYELFDLAQDIAESEGLTHSDGIDLYKALVTAVRLPVRVERSNIDK